MTNYLNPVIESTSAKVFTLDDSDFHILSEFAKLGETYRNRINLAQLSDRQISRRCYALHTNGFLHIVKEKIYRNQPKKKTIIFDLTLKGFLASLRYCNIEDNYLTKKYLKGIKDKELSKVVLNYLKDDLIYFLTHNDYRGITLNKMKNIVGWFDDYNSVYGFDDKDLEDLNKLDDNRIKSWEAMKKKTLDNPVLVNYVDWWYGVIDWYANRWNYDEIIKKISATSSTPNIEVRNTLVSISNGHIISDVQYTDMTNIYQVINKKT